MQPFCLPGGSITAENLKAGWVEGQWPNYHLLRSRASLDAQCEMQTFLSLTRPETEAAIAGRKRTFTESEPGLLQAEAATAAADAAEAAAAAEAAEAAAVAETAAAEE